MAQLFCAVQSSCTLTFALEYAIPSLYPMYVEHNEDVRMMMREREREREERGEEVRKGETEREGEREGEQTSVGLAHARSN